MHTWWTVNWKGKDPVITPVIHQQQLQQRRNRRRVQEACLPEIHSTEEVTGLLFEDRLTSRTETEQCNLLADRSSVTILTPEQTCPGSRRKRRVSEMDRATDEIVNLVEQEVQYPASQPTGTRLYPDRHISTQQIAIDTAERLEHGGTEEEAIPEWVIIESRAMSREVTPPAQYFFRNQGERQDGDCGPAAVIGTLYYIYCKTGVKRAELESLLTYRAIRQFATILYSDKLY